LPGPGTSVAVFPEAAAVDSVVVAFGERRLGYFCTAAAGCVRLGDVFIERSRQTGKRLRHCV
jgi:hypothetical protein